MKRLSGFSLMEMMIVLAIVAIVAAASAPMVNKKMVRALDENQSYWTKVNNTESIAYNFGGDGINNNTVNIGGIAPDEAGTPRLFIESNGTNPHISFRNGESIFGLRFGNKSISLTNASQDMGENSIAIGSGTQAIHENSIALGVGAKAGSKPLDAKQELAVGYKAIANYANSTAIGSQSTTDNVHATAVGYNAFANGYDSMAIGSQSKAQGMNATAVGYNAITDAQDTIAIGSGANVVAQNAIALGYNAKVKDNDNNKYSIAIGSNAEVYDVNSPSAIAIGHGANVSKSCAVAIGHYSSSHFANSVAIGPSVNTTQENQIVLGNANTTVWIPGNLVVNGITVLRGETYWPVWNQGKFMRPAQISDGDKAKTDQWFSKVKVGGVEYDTLWKHSSYSDRRLKNVGEAFKAGLAEIKKLEVFNYTFKDDSAKTPRVGVMAQDLKKIFPNSVIKGEDGFLRIRMEDMFYALVNAVKELDSRVSVIEKQQKRIDELEKRIDELEKRLDK